MNQDSPMDRIAQCAQMMISRHAGAAEQEALMRADAARRAHNRLETDLWTRVATAIRETRRV